MTGRTFKARFLIKGSAQGEALVSRLAFTFAHGVDPASGAVTDVHSDIKGANVKGKVLFYPFGKGSTTASAWFLEAVRLGSAPAAVVTQGTDLSAVIASVVAKAVYGLSIPVASVAPSELSSVKTGDPVTLDASTGEVRVGS